MSRAHPSPNHRKGGPACQRPMLLHLTSPQKKTAFGYRNQNEEEGIWSKLCPVAVRAEGRKNREQEMASDPKVYDFAEVAKHNQMKDCWLIIHGKVYDVTPYMNDHPGGDEILLGLTGRDATDDFELVGHSTSAKDLMDKYYIGEIDASSMKVKFQHIPPSETSSYSPKKSKEFMLKTLEYLVPLAILAAAFAVPHCTRTE
ncbi:cytochrome b5 [Cinnamomum micranthum f. kanehirae]|uniref:Cytochrome b5 n=1 Tax=Cinnamomum micranthum f. kanehirae TaxID=337451 RepID=A0A3S3QQJ3_9MAGN|nr:cytochrome b5 [Cinnamomum micranthum f. kanehirae]